MSTNTKRTLIMGYGNPGRQDDGLGPAFIDALQEMATEQIHLHSNYQLTVEDAYDIAEFDEVIFVDASVDAPAPFSFAAIDSTDDSGLGSHSLTPNAVVKLCETLYNIKPQAYILGIRGYEFDQFEERLSTRASHNLKQALSFLESWFNGDHKMQNNA